MAKRNLPLCRVYRHQAAFRNEATEQHISPWLVRGGLQARAILAAYPERR